MCAQRQQEGTLYGLGIHSITLAIDFDIVKTPVATLKRHDRNDVHHKTYEVATESESSKLDTAKPTLHIAEAESFLLHTVLEQNSNTKQDNDIQR